MSDIYAFDFLCTCICMWESKGSLYFGFYWKCQSLDYVIVVILCSVSKVNKMQEGLHINACWILVPAVMGLGSFYYYSPRSEL